MREYKIMAVIILIYILASLSLSGLLILIVESPKNTKPEYIEYKSENYKNLNKSITMKNGANVTKSTIFSEDGEEKFVKVELPHNKCIYFSKVEGKDEVVLRCCEIEEHTYEEIEKFKMTMCLETVNVMGLTMGDHLFDDCRLLDKFRNNE